MNEYHPSRRVKHPRTCSGCQALTSEWYAIDTADDWQRAYCPECIAEQMAIAEVGMLTDNLRRRLDSIRPHRCADAGCRVCGGGR